VVAGRHLRVDHARGDLRDADRRESRLLRNSHQALRICLSAYTFENEGVHAYSGQAFNIKDPKVLPAALSIVTVEARHALLVGLIRNGTEFGIAPSGAFDKPYGATRVLKDVASLHYIEG
jgi:hypothetical protein